MPAAGPFIDMGRYTSMALPTKPVSSWRCEGGRRDGGCTLLLTFEEDRGQCMELYTLLGPFKRDWIGQHIGVGFARPEYRQLL